MPDDDYAILTNEDLNVISQSQGVSEGYGNLLPLLDRCPTPWW